MSASVKDSFGSSLAGWSSSSLGFCLLFFKAIPALGHPKHTHGVELENKNPRFLRSGGIQDVAE